MRGCLLPILVLYSLLSFAVHAQESCMPSHNGSVRLSPTPNIMRSHAGRVEICQANSTGGYVWGTVITASPSSYWSIKNGLVVCRQLRYSGLLNVILTDTIRLVDRPPVSTPIHLHNVACNGTETALAQCHSAVYSQPRNPAVFSDVYIVCRPQLRDAYSVLHTGGPVAGDIRLVGDQRNGVGIVEIFDTLLGWVTICPDAAWNEANVDGLCDQLGYENGLPVMYSGVPLDAVASRTLHNTECPQGRCRFSVIQGPQDCAAEADTFAGIECSSSAATGAVRLVGGAHEREGILEIFLNQRWGVVCGDNWRQQESGFNHRTVCAQLGFDGGDVRYLNSTSFLSAASSLQPLWLEEGACSSRDSSLLSCSHGLPVGYARSCGTPSKGLAAISCGDPSSPLSGGASAGIAFALFFGVCFGFCSLCFLKDGCCNESCECDSSANCCCSCFSNWRRRRRQGQSNRASEHASTGGIALSTLGNPLNGHTAVTFDLPETAHAARRNRQDSSTAAAPSSSSQPTAEPSTVKEEGGGELTKTAPPSYYDATAFPSPAPPVLPPPYPGGSGSGREEQQQQQQQQDSELTYPPPPI